MANLQDIKSIPIADILSGMGIEPVQRRGKEWYYYRFYVDGQHKEPHLAVDISANLFRDLVDSTRKGSVIDLVMMLNGCSFHDAVKMLEGNVIPTNPVVQDMVSEDGQTTITIKTIRDVKMSGLIQYAHSRGISTYTLNFFCREIFFNFNKGMKDVFGIGFQTDSDSWVIRNAKSKMNIGCQDITTIRFHQDKDVWFVFEGFFSFMSYCEYMRKEPVGNVIVLNSVSNLDKVWKRFTDRSRVFWLGDNDNAGDIAFNTLQGVLGGRIKDARGKYKGYNDLNDFLLAERGAIR